MIDITKLKIGTELLLESVDGPLFSVEITDPKTGFCLISGGGFEDKTPAKIEGSYTKERNNFYVSLRQIEKGKPLAIYTDETDLYVTSNIVRCVISGKSSKGIKNKIRKVMQKLNIECDEEALPTKIWSYEVE